jgi:two-component system NtrC family sensor kinase
VFLIRCITILIAILWSGLVQAQIIAITQTNYKIAVNNRLVYLEDPNHKLTVDEVLKSNNFQRIATDVPNFGISSSAFWLKISVSNQTGANNFQLQVSHPGLDNVSCYQIFDDTVFSAIHIGEEIPFNVRPIPDPDYIFRLQLPQQKISTILLKISARDNIQVPISIGTPDKISESNNKKDLAVGIYIGIMLVMFFYNAFLYVTVKDKVYLYYIIYLITVLLTQASIHGYTFKYLWPSYPGLAIYSSFLFPTLVGIASMIFMREFLHVRFFYAQYDKGFNFFIGAYIVASVLSLFDLYKASFLTIEIIATLVSLYMLFVGYLIYKKGYRPAKYFLLAWTVFLIGVTIYVLKDFSILPYNNYTLYTMPIGSAVEVVLLSFALADRINILKKEKEQSQSEALEVLRENEKLISEQNTILERKVNERTIALQAANDELGITLKNLKDAQAQLVNAEKMASLGQLTAGIAHEINNPINFVSANVRPLQLDIADVLKIIEKYDSLNNEADFIANKNDIEKYKKEIDFEYLKNEINILINGIEDGAKRTAEIVKGLKNFSRLDESDIKEANLNEGIESTLVLLRNSMPKNVTVNKELGTLPNIECYPGKLNQVFMNIFNNALQAIEKNKKRNNHIFSIKSELENEHIKITVSDTGIGMDEKVKSKIFEPFFTTKDVGEGTGLGMSIVYSIVESHQGQIEIVSEPDNGCKVILYLPVHLKRKASTKP